jgi:hypothetical protein
MGKRDSRGLLENGAGWTRFERAVDAAVKSGPKHKTAMRPLMDYPGPMIVRDTRRFPAGGIEIRKPDRLLPGGKTEAFIAP